MTVLFPIVSNIFNVGNERLTKPLETLRSENTGKLRDCRAATPNCPNGDCTDGGDAQQGIRSPQTESHS